MAEKVSLQGTHKAIAKSWDFDVLGGQEVVKVLFELRGAHAGRSLTWTGFFGDKSVERTLNSLRHCGWTGETLGDLRGMGEREVEVVIEPEEYNGRTYDKIKWVNRPASLFLKDPLSPESLRRFSERMARLTSDNARTYGVAPAAAAQKQETTPYGPTPPESAYDGPPDDMSDDLPF